MPSPNPAWKPGDKITVPFTEMVSVDPATVPAEDFYKVLNGAVVPRPVAFVSTMGKNGVVNLAPFSFFNAVSADPPCLMISISPKSGGGPKDTLRNIEETGQFVVHSANEWIIEPLVHCAAVFPYGVDEMKKVGLTAIPSERVAPPRVKESAVHFECEVYKLIPIGDPASPRSVTLVLGKVLLAHIDKDAFVNGRIEFQRIRNIGRLGGHSYGKLTDIFEIPVPRPAKE